MLNVSDALAVSPFLFFLVLVFLVGSFDGSGAVAGRIHVENPHIKICVLRADQNPLAQMSRRALSVVMAER